MKSDERQGRCDHEPSSSHARGADGRRYETTIKGEMEKGMDVTKIKRQPISKMVDMV